MCVLVLYCSLLVLKSLLIFRLLIFRLHIILHIISLSWLVPVFVQRAHVSSQAVVTRQKFTTKITFECALRNVISARSDVAVPF